MLIKVHIIADLIAKLLAMKYKIRIALKMR